MNINMDAININSFIFNFINHNVYIYIYIQYLSMLFTPLLIIVLLLQYLHVYTPDRLNNLDINVKKNAILRRQRVLKFYLISKFVKTNITIRYLEREILISILNSHNNTSKRAARMY